MPRATPGDSRWREWNSLEGYTPAKMRHSCSGRHHSFDTALMTLKEFKNANSEVLEVYTP